MAGILECFFDRIFPHKMREDKVKKFLILRKVSIIVKKYCLKFTKFSKYTPELLHDSRACMSKFVTGVCNLVVKQCTKTMLIGDIDISRVTTNAQ